MPFISSVNYAAAQALLFGCLLILGGCSGGKAAPPAPTPTVEVATVIERDTPIYSDWVATLDGYVNAEIRPSDRVSHQTELQGRRGGAKGRRTVRDRPAAVPGRRSIRPRHSWRRPRPSLAKRSLDVERDTPLAEGERFRRANWTEISGEARQRGGGHGRRRPKWNRRR